ncbi:MAG: YciI family protein [Gemmataceae bacterium]|nr:YciI family protein [Gemmataceae bacterium]
MAKFMLILHTTPGGLRKLSPEEMERALEKVTAWTEQMRAGGRIVSSEKLMDEGGKIVELWRDRLSIVDGPYAETKEVIGGYFVLRAASYDEALQLTRACPFLEFGRIAIRQTDPMGCGGE